MVLDATLDPHFAHNPRVTGSPGIRFYVGAPLITPRGFRLGTLCVFDMHPRVTLDLCSIRCLGGSGEASSGTIRIAP